jgi:hypothetical protein
MNGTYSDFGRHFDMPKLTLMEHLKQARAHQSMIDKVAKGEYDNDFVVRNTASNTL